MNQFMNILYSFSIILMVNCAFGQITIYHYQEFYGKDLNNPETRKKVDTEIIISTDPDYGDIEIIIGDISYPVIKIDETVGQLETITLYKTIETHPEFGTMMFLFVYGKTEDSVSIYFDGSTGTLRYSVY